MPSSILGTTWNNITRSVHRTGVSGFAKIDEQQADQQWNGRSMELRNLEPPPYEPFFHDSKSENTSKISIDTSRTVRTTSQSLSIFSSRRWYGNGWRFGAINCALSVIVVFFVNFIVTVWGMTRRNSGEEVIFEEECHKVSKLNSGLHLLINLLSTILLSASNYCMQCLSAPTRKETDRAHAKGVWLDIGIPSVRNLRYISKQRVAVWALLGLSSLPLHLFYNSMVFSSIASHDYNGIVVSQSFLDDTDCLGCDNSSLPDTSPMLHQKARAGLLDRLENKDCINQYATVIQSFRRNLLLVGSNDKLLPFHNQTVQNITHIYGSVSFYSNAVSSGVYAMDAYDWICEDLLSATDNPPIGYCADYKSRIQPENWTVSGFPVDYCLAEKAPPMCKLHIVLPIGFLVTSLNLLKALLILYTIFRVKEDPLMTMGDAVASFMEDTDLTTRSLCLVSVNDIKKHPDYLPADPREWKSTRYRWKDVTSITRRTTTFAMFLVALATVSGLLGTAVSALRENEAKTSLQALARLGFGSIDPRAIITWEIHDTMRNVLVANIAQPILSFLYFSYNGLFTCMLLGYEWSQYAHERKGLRVSRERTGKQRSTYFLQLPYRLSLPLMALSGVLHWLVSQSIFLVAIDMYDNLGRAYPTDEFSSGDYKSCGFSPIAIVSVLVLGIFMVLAAIGFGFVPYKPGMPLAGSCSAAMSAACHAEEWDGIDGKEAAESKVKWGVVGTRVDGVGRCAFSSKEVSSPVEGKMYA